MIRRHLVLIFFSTLLLSTLLLSSTVFATPKTINFQARIKKPNGQNLESSSVNFRFTYTDESGSCVLYSEDFTALPMPVGGEGLINIPLGTGSRVFPVAGATVLFDIFNNSSASLNCQSGGSLTPLATDNRYVVMQFNYSESGGWQTLPKIKLNAVPYSMYSTESLNASKLNGLAASSYAKLTDFTTCVGSQVLTFNGTTFSCTNPAGGTVTSVSAGAPLTSSGGSTPNITITQASAATSGYLSSADWTSFNNKMSTTLANNSFWIGDSGTPVAVVASGDISSISTTGVFTLSDTIGSSGTSSKVTYDSKGRITASSSLNSGDITSALAYTPVNKAGDSMAGSLSLPTNGLTVGTDQLTVSTGNVGIGTATPSVKLDVRGAAVSRANIIASGATVDLSLSNVHLLKSVGASAITLQNPISGGSYTLVISDVTVRTYTFSGCTNSYFNPSNGATTGQSTYSILVVVDGANTECYIAWMTGFN